MSANLPAVVPLNELERMAQAFAKSGMFGAKTPEQAMALLLLAQGEGLHPAIAMRDFDVIQGRPAKKAEAMLRSFIAAGGRVEWHEMTDERADATFSHEQGGSARITWDMKRAQMAGIAFKDNWKKYPRQMLANRVISEGCRRIYPASTSGLYVPEEVSDFRQEKDITPAAGAMQALPIKEQEIIAETSAQVKALLANDQLADAYALWQDSKFDTDQQVAFWSTLNSKEKGVLGRIGEAERNQAKGVISEPQKKRLEARIKEMKLSREGIKEWCMGQFEKQHFSELTPEEYKQLDAHLDTIAGTTEPAPPQAPPPAEPSSAADPAAGADLISAEQARNLLSYCERTGVNIGRVLLKAKVDSVEAIPATWYQRCIDYIDKAAK